MSSYFSKLVDGHQKPKVAAKDQRSTEQVDDHFGESRNAVGRQRQFELDFLARSGLFDELFYVSTYPDIAEAGVVAIEHFFDFGYKEGRRPNLYFDPQWYLTQNPDIREAGVQPLSHYASYGDIEGRKPSLLFDPSWYRKEYGLKEAENALSHYLINRKTCSFAPIPEFDVALYSRSYPDVAAANIDPFEHFISYGYREGRTPSLHFDSKFYWSRYLNGDASQNPFLHFLAHKHEPGVHGRMPEDESSIPREVKRFTKAGPAFEDFLPLHKAAPRRAKLLAYYLPQFHAFPENDLWWGNGFTEWTNVPRGLPRFTGHYQPRVPRDLGFYSLNHTDTIRRQAEMAKAGGVFGFVFYYYWFNGKRLLEKPIESFLADRTIDMPFSLMWANENWTRRWDGADTEILISQDYREEDENELVQNIVRHFKDPRYIRIQGRPLLMIYRPGLMKNAKEMLSRLRRLFSDSFSENPLLVMGQTFNDNDPSLFGMDGAIEFPPHKLTQDMISANSSLQYLDIEFEGKAYRYEDVVKISLAEPKASFPLIKTAVPSWDNDARRQGNGLVLIDSTPQKYESWLRELVDRAVDRPFFGEPIVCVNAWNEWCEAAYLEPDLHYGYAYLNATARAMVGKIQENRDGRIILVGHDCFPGGAQHLLLNIGRVLQSNFGVEISTVLLDGGKLEEAYRSLGAVKILPSFAALEGHLWSLREAGFNSAIVNTSAAASAVAALAAIGIDVTMLVHELPRILNEKNLIQAAGVAVTKATRIVFPAEYVLEQFCKELKLSRDNNMLIIPQGMYSQLELSQTLRTEIRKEFHISKGHRLIIGMGYADLRKGFDLFMQIWRLIAASSPVVHHFCWIGDIDPFIKTSMAIEIDDAKLTGTFHMPGYRPDVSGFFSAADAFALTSREDPFPSVVLEALHSGLPTFAFDRSGGTPELLRTHPLGCVAPFADTVSMANAITTILRKGISTAHRDAGHQLIKERFDFSAYVWKLLKLSRADMPEISVVIPNYNYAHHMQSRLATIFSQSLPVKEIVVLDDCSTDNSLAVIPVIAHEWNRSIRLIPNKMNSGSVFKQWRKAAEETDSEYLWIAEADDLSSVNFLSSLADLLRHDSSITFAFSDSKAIDANGTTLWDSYKSYYSTVRSGALCQTEIFEAKDFVLKYLSVKNLILNVSAVVWRRDALMSAMAACEIELKTFKMAGDWRLYLQALATTNSRVGYMSEPLNVHRRHAGSVTHSLDSDKHVSEVASCQAFARDAFELGKETKVHQDLYLREISKQLGAGPAHLRSGKKGRPRLRKSRDHVRIRK